MTDTIWHPDLTQFPGPKYLALTRALRDAIRNGTLKPGVQLPPVRDLGYLIGATPGTVARAYQLATQEGLLAATVGRGTFVAATAPRLGPAQSFYIERDPGTVSGLVDLRSPRLPDVGQRDAITQAMAAIAGRMDANWLEYPSPRKDLPLREAVCDWLSDHVLGPLGADDIALSHGGQNAINLVFQCCLRGDRPVILTEDLAYAGMRHAARLLRAEVVGVEMDSEGLLPDALEAACRRHGPQILCVTPEAQNPTTVRMGVARRQQIVAIARAYDLQILEDDCYSLTESHLPSLRALAPERTWYIGSLSKSVSASLRFGYIACPRGMGDAGRLTAQHSFFGLARPVSDLCLELFTSGDAARLRTLVQAEFALRLQSVVNALGAFDLAWQPGLPFVWLRLPSGWRTSTFTRTAEAEGILLRSADEYALIHGRAPHAVRLAISRQISRDRFDAAMATLARLLANPPSDLTI